MPAPQKVTDPKKIVTDPEMLRDLVRQGIDKDYVEFHEDYTIEHPSAKFYRDLKSGKQFMVVSGLPRVEDTGRKIEVGWLAAEGRYYAKANLFSAVVEGMAVRVSIRLDKATWNPQLFLNGVEQSCSEATLLGVDPDNENYHNNVLEWDYGFCKRRLRLIEGAILERWIVPQNPYGEVRIKHNQSGELKLGFGVYQINDDEELVPASVFDEAEYPFEIGASLTVYSTASDCRIRWRSDVDYATGQGASTGDYCGAVDESIRSHNTWSSPYFTVWRCFLYFDISALGAGATPSAVSCSVFGKADAQGEANAGHSDLYLYEGTQADPATTADFDSFQTTLLTDTTTPWEYPLTTDDYNVLTLNADGISLVDTHKEGTVMFCLRVKGDFDASEPSGSNITEIWANEKGTGYQPKLVVTYTAPVEKTSSDSGSGSETLLSRAYVLPEVGTGSEALGSRLLAAVEQGAGAETLLARLLAGAETALGLDAGRLIFTSSDVGSGSDVVLALEALLTGADSGSGIDTSFIIKALLSADSGLGTEAVAALLAKIVAGELMVGSDRLVVKIESAPMGGGMRLPPGGKTSIPSRRVSL